MAAVAQSPGQPAPDLVISDVTVVSPERAAPLEHAYVRIRAGRIEEVGTQPLDAEQRIDGKGLFLIPGLIDSHVHLGGAPGIPPDQGEQNAALVSAYRAQEPRSYLYFGFTTVIELFGSPGPVARFNEAALGPDAFFCGGAPIANGYPMVFTPEDLRFRTTEYFLYDERQKDRIPDYVDPSEHAPEAVARRIANDGGICVKTTFETGFGAMRDLPTPSLEMMAELVDASHARDMPVVMHANSKEAQEFAVDAEADVIAHGLWNGMRGDSLTEDVYRLIERIAEQDIGYQPTFQVLYGEVDLFDEDFLRNPLLLHAYPSALIEWYGSDDGGWFRDEIRANLPPEKPAVVYAPLFRRLERITATLADREARLLFGSDTPSGPTYANPPGLNGLWEIHRWADAGVSTSQIFRALTLENARTFGLDERVGSVEAGKTAHLLLLRENPLERVDAYDAIQTVILHGQPIERAELSAQRLPSD